MWVNLCWLLIGLSLGAIGGIGFMLWLERENNLFDEWDREWGGD